MKSFEESSDCPFQEMHEAVQPLRVLREDEALVLRAEKDLASADFPQVGVEKEKSEKQESRREMGEQGIDVNPPRKAGEEWLFVGLFMLTNTCAFQPFSH
jgi:hypothetical protein